MSNDINTHSHPDTKTHTRTHTTPHDRSAELGPGADDHSCPPLEHVTVENDGAPDECALFPCEATETELHTTWMTAQGESFVDLESMR
ncbi:DUF7511 domain-containing protein [Halomontanus rarus]|uniref:DUF7511 domain-containing protein n=1 Tax=Halomontanus rarus TaxID=3034020 RepID=UPI0023E8043A|nr:hypothetical protein [Halovivax sp. TS33]